MVIGCGIRCWYCICYSGLKAVKFGLEKAWYQRIEKIVVEMDSPNIINLLSEELEENPFGQVVNDC